MQTMDPMMRVAVKFFSFFFHFFFQSHFTLATPYCKYLVLYVFIFDPHAPHLIFPSFLPLLFFSGPRILVNDHLIQIEIMEAEFGRDKKRRRSDYQNGTSLDSFYYYYNSDFVEDDEGDYYHRDYSPGRQKRPYPPHKDR